MNLIAHRKNTLAELQETPRKYGIEIDVRSSGDQLILAHDPFVAGELLVPWLDAYQHGTLILNVKEEGLEAALIDLMACKGITDYFLLDQSFPFLIKWAKTGFHQSAVRFSEYESISTVLGLAGLVDWVWVDCFTRFSLTSADYLLLKRNNFKLCLVSPELQGRDPAREIPPLLLQLKQEGMSIDAVCTKRPDLWELVLQ